MTAMKLYTSAYVVQLNLNINLYAFRFLSYKQKRESICQATMMCIFFFFLLQVAAEGVR